MTAAVGLVRVSRLLLLALGFFALASHFTVPLLTLFPMENADLSFGDASWIYGAYGMVGSLFGMAGSGAFDLLPALPVMLAGVVASATARLTLSAVARASPVALVVVLCGVLPASDALMNVTAPLAMKRLLTAAYGDPERVRWHLERYIALAYAIGNGVDVLANAVYDLLRHLDGVSAAEANALAAVLAGASLLAGGAVVAACMAWAGRADRAMQDVRVRMFTVTCGSARFWRFTGVCALLTGVRMLFRHLDLTLTIYLLRAIGPHAHFPLVQSINPFFIMCATPFMPWLLARVPRFAGDGYATLVLGTAISSAAPLVLALLLAAGAPVVVAAVAGVVLFSLGEVVWSPRFLSYALEIAPEGSEAVYAALSSLPALVVKLPTSWLSIALVEAYCPRLGACDGRGLWAVIGLVAATSPLLLAALRGVLREEPAFASPVGLAGVRE